MLTIAGTSGKFDNAAYRVSAGLHGMGAKAMTALSEWCEAEVRRDGRVYKMEYERGNATSELQDLGPAPAGQTGTTITFKPDPEIFGELTFDYDTLDDRFRELAFLNKGLAITLTDERDGKTETFHFEGGIAEYVVYLNQGETVEHAPIYVPGIEHHDETSGTGSDRVEVALQYTTGEDETSPLLHQQRLQPGGGTHLSGFRAGLTRALNAYGKKEGPLQGRTSKLNGEDFREGLTAVVSIGHPEPQFESQTKIRLNNPEVEGIVTSVVYEYLTEYLEKNPKEATRICKKIALAAEAADRREEGPRRAQRPQEDPQRRRPARQADGLHHPRPRRERAVPGRGRLRRRHRPRAAATGMYQAILPLRGKVLNVEKARLEKLLENNEIAAPHRGHRRRHRQRRGRRARSATARSSS